MNREFVRRAAFLGTIAWVSVCLIIVGMAPQLYDHLSEVWILSGLLGLVSSVGLIEVVKRDRDRHSDNVTNMTRAKRDELTGLSNRWEFDRLINIMVADAQDHDLDLSLVLIDVDTMREVNRREGYAAGDEILLKVSQAIIAATRGADLLARYDDDEFAVVLADVDRKTCETIITRLRGKVHESVRIGEESVTVSVGASCVSDDDDAESLVHRAELALFQSKSDGRDRGCYHDGKQLEAVHRVALVRA